jgi:hypothetical protein
MEFMDDKVVQELAELSLTVNNQSRHQHKLDQYHSALQAARRIVLKRNMASINLRIPQSRRY